MCNTGCNKLNGVVIISSDRNLEKDEMYVVVEDVHLLRVSMINMDILDLISELEN